jgi:predicted outer membrane lipoprotein
MESNPANVGAMPTWLIVAVLLWWFGSVPIEARLWRSGRLSDRSLTRLLLMRVPVLGLVAGWAESGSPVLGLFLACALGLPPALLYRIVLDMIREQSALRNRARRHAGDQA